MTLDLDRIPEAVRHEGGISRRLFMGYLASLAALPLVAERAAHAQSVERRASFSRDPFSLGVVSGDPDAQGVVLWTKLAPDPLAPDAGMGVRAVEVTWEVAEDEAMRKVVRRGTAVASPELGHSVHAEVTGLSPDRWYWYRFRAGDAETQVARTRTLPAPHAMPERLRFAFASCQHYETGLYGAYEHMSRDELDLVLFLGDYIYEGPPTKKAHPLRRHSATEAGGPAMTLADYRVRYAQYRLDGLLQAAHARCPWFVTWDDHEVSNDYADDVDGAPGLTPAEFLRRRAHAYRAYYEMMPLRAGSAPKGPDMRLYRGASFGRLAELLVLDTRQYRSDQANGGHSAPLTGDALSPGRTILGAAQKAWMKDRLTASQSVWNVVAQQVMMGMLRRHPAGQPGQDVYSMDKWSGYAHERFETVRFMRERGVRNPVVLTGDIHANYVNDLREDDRRTDDPVVAAEFVGTSISSAGDGVDQPEGVGQLMADNAGLKYHNAERGYVRCTVTPELWKSDYVTVAKVSELGQPAQLRASFVVEAGRPGIQPA